MANFRQKLAEQAANSGGSSSKDLLLINMQSPKNQGRLVFVPFTPKGYDDSVIVLNKVMEVGYQYTYKDKNDGDKEKKNSSYYRLLNREDYDDLSPEEEDHYKFLRSLGSKLNGHVFSKNKTQDREEKKKRIRFKDYVLLVGWVIEHRDLKDKLINKQCPAILAFSSSNFTAELDKQLKARDKKNNSSDWQTKLFNDNLERTMYLSIEYKLYDKDSKKIGYDVTINIEKFDDESIRYTGGDEDKGYNLHLDKFKEKLDLLKNPLHKFTNVQGRLYNQKMIDDLTERLKVLINKYCGGTYELKGGKKVDPVKVKDPMDGVEPEKKDLPKTDEEQKKESAPSGKDAWND